MIIDGKKFAQELRNEIKKEIESIKKTRNTTPGLTVVLVGNHTMSGWHSELGVSSLAQHKELMTSEAA